MALAVSKPLPYKVQNNKGIQWRNRFSLGSNLYCKLQELPLLVQSKLTAWPTFLQHKHSPSSTIRLLRHNLTQISFLKVASQINLEKVGISHFNFWCDRRNKERTPEAWIRHLRVHWLNRHWSTRRRVFATVLRFTQSEGA